MVGWVLMLGQSQEYCSVRSLKDRGLLFGTGKNNVYRVFFKILNRSFKQSPNIHVILQYIYLTISTADQQECLSSMHLLTELRL